MKLWKRFTAWLHYLRHPCTIITMDEAPAKGVQINLTYTGEYSVIAKQVQEGMERAKNTVGRAVKDQEALDHVEECLDILSTGIMVGLRPREATLGQRYLESQIAVVESVKADFKKLQEAIQALRKGQ